MYKAGTAIIAVLSRGELCPFLVHVSSANAYSITVQSNILLPSKSTYHRLNSKASVVVWRDEVENKLDLILYHK